MALSNECLVLEEGEELHMDIHSVYLLILFVQVVGLCQPRGGSYDYGNEKSKLL